MAVAALAAAVFGTGLATSSAKPAKRAVSKTVYMRFNGQQIKFVAPDTVRSGADLRVINKTDPQVIGPHSFSLVQRSDLPKTRRARRACFAPGHICREIAKWHGSNGQSPPTKNPAKAGKARLGPDGIAEKGRRFLVRRQTQRVDHPGGLREGSGEDLLHVRDPSVHAGIDQGSAVGGRPLRRA